MDNQQSNLLVNDAKKTDDTIKNFMSKQQEQFAENEKSLAATSGAKLVDNEMKRLVLNQYQNRAQSGSDRYLLLFLCIESIFYKNSFILL